MPILDVEVVLDNSDSLRQGWAQRIADAAGDIFKPPPERTWVRLRGLPRTQNAVNGPSAKVMPLPAFVSILKAKRSPESERRKEAARLSERVAEIVHRPLENVHVVYLPPGEGRIAFGGRLMTQRRVRGEERDGAFPVHDNYSVDSSRHGDGVGGPICNACGCGLPR